MFSSMSPPSRSKNRRHKSGQKPWKGANEVPFASSSPPPAGFRSISPVGTNESESAIGLQDTDAAVASPSTAHHPTSPSSGHGGDTEAYGKHDRGTPSTPCGRQFLLSLKSFAARNPVFIPGAQPEHEASGTKAETHCEISDQEGVTPIHDTPVEDPAENEVSREGETNVEPLAQGRGPSSTNIRISHVAVGSSSPIPSPHKPLT